MKKLFHIHIPKTAGCWLNSILEEHVQPHGLLLKHTSRDNWHVPLHTLDSTFQHPAHAFGPAIIQPWSPPQINWKTTLPPLDGVVPLSICRNPFDLLVSFYHHGEGRGLANSNIIHRFRSFEEFITCFCDPTFPFTNLGGLRSFLFCQMFRDDGVCGVTLIMRYEKLYAEVARLLDIFPENKVFQPIPPPLNVSKTRKKKDHRFYYTDKLREMVEKKCDAELELFGYNFDGPLTSAGLVDPCTLYYHPVGKIAGRMLPDDLIEALTELLELVKEHDPAILRTQAQHIYPDVYINDGSGKRLIWNVGNQSDPKLMNDIVLSSGIEIAVEPHKLFRNGFGNDGALAEALEGETFHHLGATKVVQREGKWEME